MTLYKYRDDLQRDIFKTLVENKLYAPDKDKLNDPTEMCFDDSDFLSFLEKNKKHTQDVKNAYENMKNFAKNECGIFSLSKDVKNELLWAYYANGHKGFCIEYDTKIIMKSYNYGLINASNNSQNMPLVHRINVHYSDNYPIMMKEYVIKKDFPQFLKCTMGTKSKNWDREEEVRLIFNKHGFTELDYRAVKGIYFGVNFDKYQNNKKDIMRKLQGRGIKYHQMKFIDNSYKMDFDEIQDIYSSAPSFIANDLQYDDIQVLSENEKYKDLAIQALDFVSKEPCINKIKNCYICSEPNPMISIQTVVNKDFKIYPIKTYRFDITTNKIKLREFSVE